MKSWDHRELRASYPGEGACTPFIGVVRAIAAASVAGAWHHAALVHRALAFVALSSPLAGIAIGCHETSHVAGGAPDASGAPAAPGPPLPPPPVAPQERVLQAAVARMEAALSKWNDATNAHDLDQLAAVYDESVSYYGAYLPKNSVLASKARAFEILPDYRQEISDIAPNLRDLEGGSLFFTKTWGPPGRIRSLRAKVGFRAYDGGPFVVVQETDAPTERATEKNLPTGDCRWTAELTIRDLPVVDKRIHAAYAAIRDSGVPGLDSMGPESDGHGASIESFGFKTGPISEELLVWRLRRNGDVRVTLEGKEVALPAKARKAIKDACAP